MVRMTPLVAIDLIIRDAGNRVLLGLRTNEPAKGLYFVPGGRIYKNERISDAFERILKAETGCVSTFDVARFVGVYEHIYDTNLFADEGYGTHYVVLGYEVEIELTSQVRPDPQHSQYAWWAESAALESDEVHEYTKAYFRNAPPPSHP